MPESETYIPRRQHNTGCRSVGHAHSFVGIVEKETGARVLNAGMGSTRIAASDLQWDEPHWHALDFVTRAAVLPDDCDFIFVFGGTNDYGDGDAPVGDETDKGVNTFAGAVNRLITLLTAKYGRERVVVHHPVPEIFGGGAFLPGERSVCRTVSGVCGDAEKPP